MFDKKEKNNMFDKKENKLFKIPETLYPSGTSQTRMSQSRTYMVGVYDPVSPNEIRFEKVTLPEFAPNTVNNAKLQYLLDNIEEAAATRIIVCISIEEYLNATHTQFTQDDTEDIELTLKKLYDWNAKQEMPFVSYNMALSALLKRVALLDNFDKALQDLKERNLGY